MNFKAWIEQHKGMAAGLAVVLVILFYFLMRGSGSTGAAATTGAGDNSVLGYDEQMAQVNSANSQQSAALQAQLDAAQIQASSTEQANQLSAQVQESTNDTNLAATVLSAYSSAQSNALNTQANLQESTNQLQYAQNVQQMSDSSLEDEIGAGVEENQDNIAGSLDSLNAQLGYYTNSNDLTAGLDSEAITDSTSLQSQQLSDEESNAQQVLGYVGAAGLNHGTASLEGDLTGVVQTVLGNGGSAASIAASGDSASAASSAASASIISNLTAGASKVVTGLFA